MLLTRPIQLANDQTQLFVLLLAHRHQFLVVLSELLNLFPVLTDLVSEFSFIVLGLLQLRCIGDDVAFGLGEFGLELLDDILEGGFGEDEVRGCCAFAL
jgi:hypothetical protein